MAVHLVGQDQRRLTLGYQVWCAMLDLAQMYDWRPMGTRSVHRPLHVLEVEVGEATYFSTEAQQVEATDAYSLAYALSRALDDLPDHDAMEQKQAVIQLPGGTVRVITTCAYTPIELLSGANKLLVEQLIAFGTRGGFSLQVQPRLQLG